MIDDSTQHIARISYGKDSLKMLDVIRSRGLPLDRITTTDVWATDTISANLPPKWDLDSPVTFKADGHTVHDFDRRFQMEDERKVPNDNTFRWRMLDEPPKFISMIGEQLTLF